MLKDEQAPPAAQAPQEPLTYGAYLRVPELLDLQTRLSSPPAHDEMLFILAQQVQELWFKQILHELRGVIGFLQAGEIRDAIRLISRINRIFQALNAEVGLLQTMPPQSFHQFRHVLVTSSGFESQQFRELELASGLEDPTFLKLMTKHFDIEALQSLWPMTLHTAFLNCLASVHPDPVSAAMWVYTSPGTHPQLFELAEALSEYEILFSEWRFQHIKVVERTIGDRSPGTAGSTGAGYLGRTLGYRFFPELWEARNRMTEQSGHHG